MKSAKELETAVHMSVGNSASGVHPSNASMPIATRSTIEISFFVPRMVSDPLQTSEFAPRRLRVPRFPWGWASSSFCRRALPRPLCAGATLLLHALLLAPFLDGVAGRAGGAGWCEGEKGSDRLEVRIIEDQDPASSGSLEQYVFEPVLTRVSLSLPFESDLSPIPAAEPDAGAAGRYPPSQRAAGPTAVGSYLEQIVAVVDRAWLRPQIAIGAPEFACQVRIDQNPKGQIENAALEECDPNVRWQLSLLTAIRSLSPLPAPADPSQFRSTLHIVFKSKRRGS